MYFFVQVLFTIGTFRLKSETFRIFRIKNRKLFRIDSWIYGSRGLLCYRILQAIISSFANQHTHTENNIGLN